jgi:hypothetical protein
MFCSKCGKELVNEDSLCPSCGTALLDDHTNHSGDWTDKALGYTGVGNGPMPEEIKGWNWGAFLLSWIWAIKHNVWMGLIAIIPYAGWVMAIVLGLKGSEWAWQNRMFSNVEEFKTVQKAWTKWGVICIAAPIVLYFVGIFLVFGISYSVKSPK